MQIPFSEYCKMPELNCSTLKGFLNGSFFELYNAKADKDTKALGMGRALHDTLEHMGVFPEDTYFHSKYDTLRSTSAREEKAIVEQQGKYWLNLKEGDLVKRMVDAIRENSPKYVLDCWEKGLKEETLTGEVFEGEPCKGRFDLIHDGIIIDWKTTCQKNLEMVRRDAYKYHYNMQAYFYKKLAELNGIHVKEFIFLFVSTETCEVWPMKCTPELISWGADDCAKAYERVLDFRTYVPDTETVYDFNAPEWVTRSQTSDMVL